MAAFEFGVPMTLVTPAGTSTFNGTGDGLYLDDISVRRDVRAPVDDVPQRSGGIIHPFFTGASFITATARIQAEAGFSTRRSSMDTLRGNLLSLLKPTAAQLVASCRLRWVPSGANERMYDAVRLYDMPPPETWNGIIKRQQFTLVCPYPYALDLTQTTTNIPTSGTTTIANAGNAPMFPVLKMNGGTGTITNTTTGEGIELSGATVSAYAEIDCFQETAFADGSGANLQGKIVQASSTFFALAPGNNVMDAATVSTDVLFQAAWV